MCAIMLEENICIFAKLDTYNMDKFFGEQGCSIDCVVCSSSSPLTLLHLVMLGLVSLDMEDRHHVDLSINNLIFNNFVKILSS